MKKLWDVADLIDLHFFFQADEAVQLKEGEAVLAKRDRIIYLAKIEPQLGKADTIPPRLLVRKWLAVRQLQYLQEKGREGLILPGTVWRELVVLCRVLFLITVLLTGAGLAGAFLVYSGSAPLNVSVYFGLFVALQLLVAGLQSLLLLYRQLRRRPMEATLFYVLLGRLLIKLLDGMRRGLQRKLSGRQRLDLAALVGGIRQRKELAALLIWPAFTLMQLGGIGFNLGILAATLAKVVFSDIAFGWQSSLRLSADVVARLVQWIALPWSWAIPNAYPSLAQIQGSQMVLKEGVAHLATADLVSWWPFLCCAVAVYGLLPRLALLVLGLVRQKRALEQLHFASLGIRPLLQRMTAPRVDTNGVFAGEGAAIDQPPLQPAAMVPSVAPGPASSPVAGTALFFLLIPDELFEECPLPQVLDVLRPRTGDHRVECLRHGQPGVSEAQNLAAVQAAREGAGLLGIFLLQEAWQPPLKETELMVHNLRQVAGEDMALIILLIGKPSPQTLLTPVKPEQLHIWQQKMRAIGDSYLDVLPLVPA